jgi:hypothetical protein
MWERWKPERHIGRLHGRELFQDGSGSQNAMAPAALDRRCSEQLICRVEVRGFELLLPPCEICTGIFFKELPGVEDRQDACETPGQWPSMAESAVMILHRLRAGSPVVTNTGCCPSAARRSHLGPRDRNLNRLPTSSQLYELGRLVSCGSSEPLMTVHDRCPRVRPLWHGPSAD